MKPYTWDEIKEFLIKELKKTRHIMTFGTISSRDINKDVDTVITKKPASKSSEFYTEIHNLFDSLNNYLNKKYGGKLIRTSRFDQEEEIKIIANYDEDKDLVFQVMTYISLPQLRMHWLPNMIKGVNVETILKETYNTFIGDINDLFSEEFSKEGIYDACFLYMNDLDRINSNYSEQHLVLIMNKLFDYILRKLIKIKPFQAKNKKEIRKYFYKMCDILDKLNNEPK